MVVNKRIGFRKRIARSKPDCHLRESQIPRATTLKARSGSRGRTIYFGSGFAALRPGQKPPPRTTAARTSRRPILFTASLKQTFGIAEYADGAGLTVEDHIEIIDATGPHVSICQMLINKS